MRTLRFVIVVVLVSAFAVIPAQTAKAKGQASKIVISGPGLKNAVEVTDTTSLVSFSLGQFEQFNKQLNELPSLGEGYEIARYIEEPGGTPFLFDHLHYFPSQSGETGYIFYDGLDEKAGWSDYDGNWYRASKTGDATMRSLLAKLVTSTTQDSAAQADLGRAPTSCKGIAKLEKAVGGDQQAVKISDSIWVGGFDGPEAALRLDGDSAKRADHGWIAGLDWLTRSSNGLVTVWGRNLDDNSQLWFSVGAQNPSAVLTFDPSALKTTEDWSRIQAKIYVQMAGCYTLSVYLEGHKIPISVNFAAGS